MATHATHDPHEHRHGTACGHAGTKHDDHTDYLHDGHLHHTHEGHIDEHELSATSANPTNCTSGHDCDGHDASHRHDRDCGHEPVPHAGHVDYVVQGRIHNQHRDHCEITVTCSWHSPLRQSGRLFFRSSGERSAP